MRFKDFIDALHAANWGAINDAQSTEIRKLWAKLFPVVAELEEELLEADKNAERLCKELDQKNQSDDISPNIYSF